MQPKELPENIKSKLQEWLGPNTPTLHFWEQEGTYFIVARNEPMDGIAVDIYCIRIFPVDGGRLALSQDDVIYDC